MSEENKVGVGQAVPLADDDLPVMSVGGDAPIEKPVEPVVSQEPKPVVPEAENKQGDEEPEVTMEDEYDIEPPKVTTTSEPFIPERGKAWDYDTPLEGFNGPIEDIMHANRNNPAEFREDPANKMRIRNLTTRAQFFEAMRRAGSDWTLNKKHGKHSIGIGTPAINSQNNVLRGTLAQTILRRVANLGANIVCVLPRSCIYLEITPPGDDAIIAYDYAFLTDRSNLGMSTAGLLLSATSGTFVAANVELALSHVVNTNVQNLGGSNIVTALMERIDPLDYPIIMNAMMAARYPNGYPWVLKCMNPQCDGKVEGRLNFGRTQRIDFSMLTDEQLDMLATKNRSITDAELKKYRDGFRVSDKSRFEYSPEIEIHLTTGNLMSYADNSAGWKTTIETSQTKALTSYATDNERKTFTDAQIQAHYMRKFAHFVEKIVITTGDQVSTIEGYEEILESLTTLSKNVERAMAFEEHVISWIEDNTMAIIGHPSYECEFCHQTTSPNKEGAFRNFVPLSIDRIFFIVSRLLSQRLVGQSKIQSEV